MKFRHVIFLLLFLLLSQVLRSQHSEMSNWRAAKIKWDKKFTQVMYGHNVYKTGSNWGTIAGGVGYGIPEDSLHLNLSLAYHWRFRGMYFRCGMHISHATPRDHFLQLYHGKVMTKLTDLHAGAGLRFEGRYYNFGFFIGPSLAMNWEPYQTNSRGQVTATNKRLRLGAHTELQITFKYFYDMGLGLSLYGSFNKYYQVVGLQLHFYFSNAFIQKY